MKVKTGYESLARVLQDALNQAQNGKGKERHACGEPFEQQEICQGARKCGIGAMVYQARKKSLESLRLYDNFGADAAIAECLGAINYLAAAVIVMNESKGLKLNDHSERTAAEEVEETLRWRQGKSGIDVQSLAEAVRKLAGEYPTDDLPYDEVAKDYSGLPYNSAVLAFAESLSQGQEKRPSLAELVDWSEAPEGMNWAVQEDSGAIWWCQTWIKDYQGKLYPKNKIQYKTDYLAHDWQTPLKRPVDHVYTDEEPEPCLRQQWEIDGEREMSAAEREDGAVLPCYREYRKIIDRLFKEIEQNSEFEAEEVRGSYQPNEEVDISDPPREGVSYADAENITRARAAKFRHL